MKLCYHCMTQIENKHTNICPNCKNDLRNDKAARKFLQPGTVLGGRFVVGHPLGEGGFGNTYIGWNNVLRCKVAIKEFYPEQYAQRASDGIHVTVTDVTQQARYQNGLRRFMEEARSVAALQDIKGVVAISNFFEENGTGYIVMEYLEGMDVLEILKRSGDKMDYEWCRRVILSVLHTLRQIHKRGVLHRDIAPDNIFVTNEGVIKLIDFGAAKHSGEMEQKNAEIMLKVGYAPIEQYSRKLAQGAYTDIYALAAVFYRMITGQKPLPANYRLKNDALITPSEMGISIPEQAEMAIMVCLNVNPQYRLQSADEFMEALDGLNFIPAYEPEWILPVTEEKKGFAKLPFALKIVIAITALCIAVGSIAGVVYFIRNNANQTEQLAMKNSKVVADYSGQTIEEVRNHMDDIGFKDYRIEMTLSYNADSALAGTVYKQIPQAGSELEDGILKCYVYTDEVIAYSEIRDLSAYSFAKKLGMDGVPNDIFVQREGDGEFFEIIEIQLKDGTVITKSDLKQDFSFNVDEIVKVSYCANDFFYWEKGLDNCIGKNIAEIQGSLYKVVDETHKPVETGKKKAVRDSNTLVKDSYYSFVYDPGYIFDQNKTTRSGRPVDERELNGEPIFYVVGEKLTYSGKTGNELKTELEALGFDDIVLVGSGDGTQGIISVTVIDAVTKEMVESFSLDQEVTIQIATKNKNKPVEKKKETPPQPVTPPPSQPSEPEVIFDAAVF